MRPDRLLLALAIALFAMPVCAYQAGLMMFQVADPVHGRPAPAIAVYPSNRAAGSTELGEYRIAAGSGATIAPGRFPLVVISHGHGGSRLGHHDMAVELARAGFIVAAVDHFGDSVQDFSDPLRASVLLSRPRQITALIDAVLHHDLFAAHVGPQRIGIVGFSAGGFTSLALAGAVPNLKLWERYCRRRREATSLCPAQLDVLEDAPSRIPLHDRRVRAAYVMAPLGVLFDREGLQNVRIPVRVVAGGKDRLLPLDENARHVGKNLPRPANVWVIRHAAHFTFLAPCSESLRSLAPEVCADPTAVDRAAIHKRVNQDAVQFFARELRVNANRDAGDRSDTCFHCGSDK